MFAVHAAAREVAEQAMESRHQSDLAKLKAKEAEREAAGKVAAEGVQLAVESHALQKGAEDEEEKARSGRFLPAYNFFAGPMAEIPDGCVYLIYFPPRAK